MIKIYEHSLFGYGAFSFYLWVPVLIEYLLNHLNLVFQSSVLENWRFTTYVDTGCLLIFRRVSQWKLLQHRKRPRLLREQERGLHLPREQERGLHLPREPEPGLQVLQKRQEVGCPCFEREKSALFSIFLSAALPSFDDNLRSLRFTFECKSSRFFWFCTNVCR